MYSIKNKCLTTKNLYTYTSFADIIAALSDDGFEWEERKYNSSSTGFNNGLDDIVEKLNEQLPVIVIVNISNDGHAVIVSGYDLEKKELYINDPSDITLHKRSYSFKQFEGIWVSGKHAKRYALYTDRRRK